MEFFLPLKTLLFKDAQEGEEKDLVAQCDAKSVFEKNKPFVFVAALVYFASGREIIPLAEVKITLSLCFKKPPGCGNGYYSYKSGTGDLV